MVITEIINAIASLFGYDIGDFDYFGGAAENAWDFDDALSSADKNAKKLKQGLRGFDKLNVINTKKDTGAGSGADGGINPKLMDAFNKAFDDYNSKLTDVTMKATKIRDSIMDWLGFTKEIDPLTGKVIFKYQGIKKTLSNMWDSFKKLNPVAKLFVGYLVAMTGKKIIDGFTSLAKMLGKGTGLTGLFSNLKEPTKLLANLIKTDLSGGFNGLTKSIGNSINMWSSSLTKMQKFQYALVGAGGLVISLEIVKDGMRKVADEGKSTALGLAEGFAGVAGSAGSLALALGASFGVKGAVVGAVIGGISAIIKGLDTLDLYQTTNMKHLEENKPKIESFYKDYQKYQEDLSNSFKQNDAEFGYYERLWIELQSIVDQNGVIKKGYKDRANVITEELSNALGIEIDLNGNLIKNYSDLDKKIKEVIEKKKSLAKLDVMETKAKEAMANQTRAIEEQKTAWNNLKTQKDNFYNSLDNDIEQRYLNGLKLTKEELYAYAVQGEKSARIQEILNSGIFKETENLRVLTNFVKNQTDASKEAENQYKMSSEALEGYNQAIQDWEYATKLASEGNYETLNKFFDHEKNLRGKSLEEQEEYWNTTKTKASESLEILNQNREKYSEREYEYLKEKYEEQIELAGKSMEEINGKINNALIEQTNSIEGELGDDVINSWKELANNSKDEFIHNFEKLNPDIQSKVINEMTTKVSEKGEIGEDVIDVWRTLGKTSEAKFLEEFGKLPDNLKNEVRTKMPTEGYEMSKSLQDGMDRLTPTFKMDMDTSKAEKKAGKFWDKFGSAIKSTFGFSLSALHFANGGLPPAGQLFVANEKGPELVGQIGGQSFVANQNQMMELLDKKIGNAQGGGNHIFNIYLDADHKIGTYTLDQLQDMAKSNGKPITIGK